MQRGGRHVHLFIRENVCCHPNGAAANGPSDLVPGNITLTEHGASDPIMLTWTPYSVQKTPMRLASAVVRQRDEEPGSAEKRAMDDRVARAAAIYNATMPSSSAATSAAAAVGAASSAPDSGALYAIRVPLTEVHSFVQTPPKVQPVVLTIRLRGGVTLFPLSFQAGGSKEFLAAVRKHVVLTSGGKAAEGGGLVHLVNDESNVLQRTLAMLDIGNASSSSFVETSGAVPIGAGPAAATSGGVKDVPWSILGQFSKVTKFARESTTGLFQPEAGEHAPAVGRPSAAGAAIAPMSGYGGAADAATAEAGLAWDARDLVNWRTVGAIRRERGVDALAKGMAVPKREAEVNAQEWFEMLDKEGRVVDEAATRRRMYYGGCEPAIRGEVWRFLTGYYSFTSTYEERAAIRKEKEKEYFTLRNQWKSITPRQEERFSLFRDVRFRIEKDVLRTDRGFEYFAGTDNKNLDTLFDLLLTYAFYNMDLGYCQGMSDILSPILYVVQDEVDAFWCFCSVMDHMETNFHMEQVGMKNQLHNLGHILRLVDRDLYHYLDVTQSLSFFYCFRWILINFKREFDFLHVLRLWECFWANHWSNHMHLFVAVALLVNHRRAIINNRMEFDDILKYINDLAGTLDVDQCLIMAEGVFFAFIEAIEAGNAAAAEKRMEEADRQCK